MHTYLVSIYAKHFTVHRSVEALSMSDALAKVNTEGARRVEIRFVSVEN